MPTSALPPFVLVGAGAHTGPHHQRPILRYCHPERSEAESKDPSSLSGNVVDSGSLGGCVILGSLIRGSQTRQCRGETVRCPRILPYTDVGAAIGRPPCFCLFRNEKGNRAFSLPPPFGHLPHQREASPSEGLLSPRHCPPCRGRCPHRPSPPRSRRGR